jgi:hypothetical protein
MWKKEQNSYKKYCHLRSLTPTINQICRILSKKQRDLKKLSYLYPKRAQDSELS